MAKLGYTWYPKDWGNSESVFELNLSERGLYRELIDLAMLNDNNTEIKLDTWIRKFGVSIEEINVILDNLARLKLIEIREDILFIPSCEPRLNLVRGGSNGGKKSKPTQKPIQKPFGSLEEKNDKPTPKQIEIESKKKVKRKEIEIPSCESFVSFAVENKPKVDVSKVALKYSSWITNDWKDGNDNKIVNWKSKLLNTLPYIDEVNQKKYNPSDPNQMHY